MKASFIILLSFIANIVNAQLTYEITFDKTLRFIYIDDNFPVIMILDEENQHFDLYNTDFTLFRSIDIPNNLLEEALNHLHFVSLSMFDCDNSQVEYLLTKTSILNPNEAWVKVLREDGTELFSLDNFLFINSDTHHTMPELGKGIITRENGGSLLFFQNDLINEYRVYSTCGNLPCNNCESIPNIGLSTPEYRDIDFAIYPNPTQSVLNVQYKLGELKKTAQLHIYNLKGQLIESHKLGGHFNRVNLNIEHLSPGEYIVTITDEMSILHSESFIKL